MKECVFYEEITNEFNDYGYRLRWCAIIACRLNV
jgi:hypothetical protein